jgi:hypothetical protein
MAVISRRRGQVPDDVGGLGQVLAPIRVGQVALQGGGDIVQVKPLK